MTSYRGYDPSLGGARRCPPVSGSEPQLGGEKRLNLSILDTLSRGLWTSAEELVRVVRQIPAANNRSYVDALLARLDTADPQKRLPEVAPWRGGRDQRVRIIISLGLLGDRSVSDILAQLLSDENAEVRQTAMAALGRLADERAVPNLLNVLNNADRTVHDRIAAAEALAAIHSRAAVPGIIACLEAQQRGIVQKRMVQALGSIGGEDALWALIELLQQSPDPEIRREAARALGRIDDLRSLLYLTEALDDPSPYVRCTCIQVFQHYQGPIVRAALTYALSDPDDRVRAAAAAARQ